MDFTITDKMQTILGMINEFVDKELIPMEPEFITNEFRDMVPALEEKRDMVRKMELWGPNHPKDLGGMGLTMVEHGLVSEALGRTSLSADNSRVDRRKKLKLGPARPFHQRHHRPTH